MIFPEISLDAWLKKYPDLEVKQGKCDYCDASLETTRPFISKDFVGLKAPKCPCGKGRHTTMVAITNSENAFTYWEDVMDYI